MSGFLFPENKNAGQKKSVPHGWGYRQYMHHHESSVNDDIDFSEGDI
jgi:hypothetical protein